MSADFEGRLRGRRLLAGLANVTSDAGRCPGGCVSRERRDQERSTDTSDSSYGDAVTCADCGYPVCVACQRVPVEATGLHCEACQDKAAVWRSAEREAWLATGRCGRCGCCACGGLPTCEYLAAEHCECPEGPEVA